MHPLPHHYTVTVLMNESGGVTISGADLPSLESAPPREFNGPGDKWSPENLLTGAIAACFTLTFQAMATASNINWSSLECHVTGTMDQIDKVMQFSAFRLNAVLKIPAQVKEDRALRLLERAKQNCLITNSVKADCLLETRIEVV